MFAAMKEHWILFYPLVLAALPVIIWYSENAREAFLSEVMGTLVVSLLATAVVTAITRILIKDDVKAVAVVYVLLLVFFSYGVARNILEFRLELSIGGAMIGQEPYLSKLLIVGGIVAIAGVLFYRGNLAPLVKLGMLMALALLVFNVGRTAVENNVSPETVVIDGKSPSEIQFDPADRNNLPDIYYIMVDAYSRADHIQENFGYDNTGFIDSLMNKGFFVPPETASNYSHTWVSTAAALSLRYMQPDDDEISLVNEVTVVQALKTLDYKHVHIQSGRGITKRNSRADVELIDESPKHLLINEFSSAILDWTLVAPLADDIGVQINDPFIANKASAFRKSIDWLQGVAEIPEPTFTFSHLYPLHTPYVFLKDGSVRPNATVPPGSESGRELYVEALIYTNRILEETVDKILADSETEPIIVIQGDHSAWGMPWSLHIEKEQVTSRTAVLNAIYLPEGCRTGLYPTMTPVNTFRTVFNSCLGTSLEILPDISYDARVGENCGVNEICGPTGKSHNGIPTGTAR